MAAEIQACDTPKIGAQKIRLDAQTGVSSTQDTSFENKENFSSPSPAAEEQKAPREAPRILNLKKATSG
jgi:hypothetical protein